MERTNSGNTQQLTPKELKPVLIVTYYWPPSGGAGVQRWLKFSKYLPSYGWRPIVFTPENPDFDLKDESLVHDIHPEVEVLKFPIWEPYSIFKKLSGQKELKQGQILEDANNSLLKQLAVWLRGNLFVPDPKIFWVKPASNYLLSILETNHIRHVITTGPPHSLHLIGKRLKMKVPSLTWVADFRDPWTQWEILQEMKITAPLWKRHQKLEQEVIKVSDALLVTSQSARDEFKRLGARSVKVITNGYDDADEMPEQLNRDQKFILSHVGMLSRQRNPKNLWKAIDALAVTHADMALKLIGILSDEVRNEVEQHVALKKCTTIEPSVPHQEVFSLYAQSNVLILIQTQTERLQTQLPGKLFEYLRAKKPILAIGDVHSDLATILRECNAGKCFDYDDYTGIKEFLEAAYEQQLDLTYENIEQYSRHQLTGQLATWLTQI